MRKFQFRFSSVLDLRKKKQDEALKLLSSAQKAYFDELIKKRDLMLELSKSSERIEGLSGVSIPVVAYQLEHDYIAGTKRRILQANQAVYRASRAVERAQKAFQHAKQQCRMMEILMEKAYAEFHERAKLLELRRIDEISVMRARLNKEGS